ncbi:CapA family protein [Halomonas sp. RA08-2]|uniref:CapA family protein n=1 Tax=Halomonas sp. RA08-2 TaxID=3440842 RepID=UPI003EE97872
MKFLITGDLTINQAHSASKKICPSLVNLFEKSDCNIVNLEAPVTTSKTKILKTGPHLKAHKESTLDVLKTLNVKIAALANNHIKDYGEQGLLDTISFCKENGIDTVGAGKNYEDAAQVMVLDTPEGSVAIINIAENEWASADKTTGGANGMCLIKDTKKIQEAKRQNDFVFVIVHGGHEYYNLPSLRMRKQYRFYVEQGADLVVGHHTHCISGNEVYQGSPIFYSLGNFLFTKHSAHLDWYTGLVLEVNISDGQLCSSVKLVHQKKGSFELGLLDDCEEIYHRIGEYSQIIQDEVLLEKAWREFVKQRERSYLGYWSAKVFIKNRYIKALLNQSRVRLTTTRALSYFLNLMRCEAHADLSRAVIKENLKL